MGDIDDSSALDVIFRVKRGLCGYVSYLAACEMNQAFSEYVLYEPILRILTAQNYIVRCEYPCPGIDQPATGDKKKLDFYATKFGSLPFAIEAKWLTSTRFCTANDTEKLQAFRQATPDSIAFLLVFGKKSLVENAHPGNGTYIEWGTPVYANFRKTIYGCRVFRINGF